MCNLHTSNTVSVYVQEEADPQLHQPACGWQWLQSHTFTHDFTHIHKSFLLTCLMDKL